MAGISASIAGQAISIGMAAKTVVETVVAKAVSMAIATAGLLIILPTGLLLFSSLGLLGVLLGLLLLISTDTTASESTATSEAVAARANTIAMTESKSSVANAIVEAVKGGTAIA
jgi:hypothetical protein